MIAHLNITLPTSLYRRLKAELPPKKISAFIEAAVREKLMPDKAMLDASYAAASKEKWRTELSEDWRATDAEGWPE